MRHLKFLVLLGPIAILCALIYSGPTNVSAQTLGQKGPGWCGNPEFQQLSIPISQATQSTATQIITTGSSQRIAICGFYATNGSSTLQLKSGTGTNCGTNTTTLTGAMVGTVGPVLSSSPPVIFSNNVGYNICLATGASGAAQGYLSYVAH